MFTGPVRKLFRRNDLLAGSVLVGVSYLPFKFPDIRFNNLTSLLIGVSFPLGVLLIANFVTVKLGGFSLLTLLRGTKRNNRNFTIICLVMGTILSFVSADLGGLWYYPYWSASTYILIGYVLGGWAFYFLFLIINYEALKLILDRIFPQAKRVTKYYKYEGHLYSILFLIGCGLLGLVIYQALQATDFFRHFHYSVNVPKAPYLKWPYWIISFVGIWFVCEYIEYRRKRSSLLKDTLHGYLNPLISIILISTILAVAYELQNQRVWLWRYANYPLADHTFLNIPLFVILTWPLHIAGVVVFWRAFSNSSSSFVFANSKSLKKAKVRTAKLRKKFA